MSVDGVLQPLAAYTGSEHPQAADLIAEYNKTIGELAQKGTIVAAAICVNSTSIGSNKMADIIVFEIENAAGEAATITLPYTKDHERIEYGELSVHQRDPHWFR